MCDLIYLFYFCFILGIYLFITLVILFVVSLDTNNYESLFAFFFALISFQMYVYFTVLLYGFVFQSTLSFPVHSFPFLSFPFLSFPFHGVNCEVVGVDDVG